MNEQDRIMFETYFERMQHDVHELAIEKGWHDEPREDGTMVALIHSEVSEALEELRKGSPGTKVAEELADVVIRIMDYAQSRKLDVGAAIVCKHLKNRDRPHRHGGKAF